ncbi:MAG: M48 family metallopeptidase [Parazoarcus communis]
MALRRGRWGRVLAEEWVRAEFVVKLKEFTRCLDEVLPRPIAEYVVVHELVHLHEPHHTPTFWRRMERVIPDYQRHKKMLLLRAADVEAH